MRFIRAWRFFVRSETAVETSIETSVSSSLHVFYTRTSSLCLPYTRDQLTFSTSKSATGDQNNGPALYRRHHRLLGFMRGSDNRLRQAAPRSGRPPMTAWMLVLAGASTLLLFVYLVYALLRAEDLE
jgi:K+-transporting ATPase KdpF subunit